MMNIEVQCFKYEVKIDTMRVCRYCGHGLGEDMTSLRQISLEVFRSQVEHGIYDMY